MRCETCGTPLESGNNTCVQCGQVRSGTEVPINKLQGIRGWLVLYAIGVVALPISYLLGLATGVSIHSVGIEVIYGVEFIVSMWALVLFFKKARVFPKFIVIVILLRITYDVLAWVVLALNHQATGTETARTVYSIIISALWIAYFIKSKRVQATFIEPVGLFTLKKTSV